MLFAAEVAVAHQSIATLDLVIIGIYFAIVFGIGLYFSKRERTSEEYFLAGRDIGWFFIGASLFVSNISTEHFIGLSGTGASSGLAVGHFEWLACLILLVLGWVFVPFYLRSNVFTMPEFLERRFNRNCAVYLAAISIVAYIFTKISVQLYAASVVLERVAGWSLWKTAVVLVIATGIYTVAGGLAAVIYTDTVQTLILICGAVALTIIGLHRVGGFEHLRTMVPASYFHMMSPQSDKAISVDRHIFRRADPRHLVLVHRPGNRTARAFCARRGARKIRHHFRRLPENPAGVHAGTAWHHRFRAFP